MRFNILIILLSVTVASCNVGTSQDRISNAFEAGKPIAELKEKKLKEVSGIAASVRNPGMLWAHNDSGNGAEVYLLDQDLNVRMTVSLEGIENRDWEDITIGNDGKDGKSYVYVGDIGDNDAAHEFKYIYRFEEPKLNGSSTENLTMKNFDKIVFRLEGNKKDTESLFIDPVSNDLFVISKRESPVTLYQLKVALNDTATAKKVMTLPFTEIVGADYSRESGLLIKNYENIYLWKNTNGADVASLLKNEPLRIPYEREPQGEAITWAADGSGFYTLSEMKKKKPSYLFFYSAKKGQ